MEQVRLLAESLRLAQFQYADIQRRVRAGASSRLDGLSAHQDVLTRLAQLRQVRADLAGSLRELANLTGVALPEGDLLPLDAATAKDLPADVEPATLVPLLDATALSQKALAAASGGNPGPRHPQLESLADSAESARRAADGARAGHWPKFQVSARSSLDYPNGPILERINQKTVGVTASLSIFEFDRIARETRVQEAQARSLDERRAQTEEDLRREWSRARDQWAALDAQRTIFRRRAAEAEELSRLVYESYKAGQSRYLDVQSANLRVLEAEVQSVRADFQILSQLALLADLSEGE